MNHVMILTLTSGAMIFSCFVESGLVLSTRNSTHFDVLWEEYKKRFNKTYVGHHDNKRKSDWERNMLLIEKHNEEAEKGVHTYRLNHNHLSDLSTRSYLLKMTKLTTSTRRKVPVDTVGDFYHKYHHIPEECDWREKGFETPVFNQKDCGSCYAFSIATVLQAQIFKRTEKLLPLSEQQIIDCSRSMGNYGCAGGSLRNTLKYVEKVGGLMAASDYPYVARQRKCQFDERKVIANLTRWAILPARNERALEAAIAHIGPVAASINASPHTFQLYHSGVYDDPACSSNTVNHAMLIVGYTKDAWILKNWWGNHWGEEGYMRLKRHKNRCGVANYAAYGEL